MNMKPKNAAPPSQAELEMVKSHRSRLLFNLAFQQPITVKGNTYWEELSCVGFDPQTSRLEAVVRIKQSTGYSGGLCSDGSVEYVRFFVDYGDGFQDAGLSSFRVHDIADAPPGPQHPLEYVAELTLQESEHRKPCDTPVLPKVRGVLSWNVMPSTDPNQVPHFGNTLEVTIQLQPQPTLSKVAIPHKGAFVGPPKPKPPMLSKLAAEYKKAKVPDHRLLHPVVQPLLKAAVGESYSITTAELAALKEAGINFGKLLDALQETSADTSYEELTCVGLDTATDTLGAVVHVKRPFGYSGDLCSSGSKEYVAFWADWNNDGTFEEYLGTASVDVHDINTIPPEGVCYAVALPVPNITKHLKNCSTPNIVRIRSVLSWVTPPSTTDPTHLDYWGNLLDRLVQIRPGTPGTDLLDLIYKVGGVGIDQISPTTHLAFPSSGIPVGLQDRPFGGAVWVQGRIYNTGSPGTVQFRVRYKKLTDLDIDSNWIPVTLQQTFILMHPLLYPPEQYVTQTATPDGWFDYLEDPLASPSIYERDNRLAVWYTGSLEGEYQLRLEYRYKAGPGPIHYSKVVSLVLCNTNYVENGKFGTVLDMSQTLDLVIDGGDCHNYKQDPSGASVYIHGHLRAVHPFFWYWSFDLQPKTHTHDVLPNPASRAYASLSDQGDPNTAWQLDISDLDPCGYSLTLWAYDRTIVNSNGAIVHYNRKAVGFSVTA